MNINELKEHLRRVTVTRDRLSELKKNDSSLYTLHDFIEEFRSQLFNTDHGERDRFAEPERIANDKLSDLEDIGEEKLNAAFAGNKTKLLAILNRYIKDFAIGVQAND